jgi:predicted tellurium resistance membrane protein TerC
MFGLFDGKFYNRRHVLFMHVCLAMVLRVGTGARCSALLSATTVLLVENVLVMLVWVSTLHQSLVSILCWCLWQILKCQINYHVYMFNPVGC